MDKELTFLPDDISNISNSIAHIYAEAAMGKGLRPLAKEILTSIRKNVFYDEGNLVIVNSFENGTNEMETICSLGWDKQDVDIYVRKFLALEDTVPEIDKTDPYVSRNNELLSTKKNGSKTHYSEFIESSNVQFSLDANIVLHGIENKHLVMGLFRNSDRDNFSKKDIEVVKIFQPHLANIFSDLFKRPASMYATIAGVLDSFDTLGICLLDSSLNPTSFNCTYSRFTGENIAASPLTEAIRQYCFELSDSSENSSVSDYTLPDKEKHEEPSADDNFIIEVTKHNSPTGDHFLALVYSMADLFLFRFKDLAKKYGLSAREYEILTLTIGRGYSVEKISSTMFISVSTIKKHISSAYQKMNINSQKQLISLLRFI